MRKFYEKYFFEKVYKILNQCRRAQCMLSGKPRLKGISPNTKKESRAYMNIPRHLTKLALQINELMNEEIIIIQNNGSAYSLAYPLFTGYYDALELDLYLKGMYALLLLKEIGKNDGGNYNSNI